MHQEELVRLQEECNNILTQLGYTSKVKLIKIVPQKHSKRHFELSCIFGRINRKGQPISLSDKKYVDYFEKFSVPVYNIRELSNTDGLSVQHRCNEKRRDVQIRYAKHGYKMVSWSIVEL
jgi:tRNA nucleotidyltransferase (CCA-adding enzyme)